MRCIAAVRGVDAVGPHGGLWSDARSWLKTLNGDEAPVECTSRLCGESVRGSLARLRTLSGGGERSTPGTVVVSKRQLDCRQSVTAENTRRRQRTLYLGPCNVLSVSTTDPFTLRNYGRRINCTLMAVYPGVVRVLALGVGGSGSQGMARTTETGTLRKCNARSPRDQVQIGGSRGLDTTKLDVINSICGIDSKPDVKELVAYEVTSVRLVSSGYYDNSVTVEISPMTDDDVLDPASGL